MARRLCDLELPGVAGRLVDSGEGALRAALAIGAALLACEQLGLAERCLETTVSYVRTRYQFARPVGSYQGLKHRLADLWGAITQARGVAPYAAGGAASGDPDTAVARAGGTRHTSPGVGECP